MELLQNLIKYILNAPTSESTQMKMLLDKEQLKHRNRIRTYMYLKKKLKNKNPEIYKEKNQ